MNQRLQKWIWRATLMGLLILIAPAIADSVVRGGDRSDTWRESLVVQTPEEIGQMMAEGKNVIWVDVREPQEYEEFHVPGARSLPLRAVESVSPEEFAGADLVVPYCLKDFRGYEAAKKLQEMGVQNVGLAEGFGINSWIRSEMPIAGVHPGMSDEAAIRALVQVLEMEPEVDGGSETSP